MNNKDLKQVEDLLKAVFSNKDLLKEGINGDLNLMDLLTTSDEKESPEMKNFMDTYFVSNIGGKTLVISRDDINKQFDFGNFARLKSNIKEKVKIIDKSNTTDTETAYKFIQKNCVDRFLSDKAERFDEVVFKPSGNTKENQYNFFKGWKYDCIESTKHHNYLNHIFNNICSKDSDLYEYILDWMAHIIQKPENKVDKALVLRGSQGTGKGVFIEEFGKLLDNTYHHLTNMGPLVGRFNSELVNRLLVFADEITWGGKRSEGSRLKTFISENKQNIEFKGKDVVPMTNFARLVIASNHDWVVPVEGGDRRYVIIDIDDRNKEDKKYFSDMIKDMSNGGREALMYKLVNRDISERDWSVIPNTLARQDQKILSFEHDEQWLYDSINNTTDYKPWGMVGFGHKITNKDIHQAYISYMKDVYPGQYMKTSREISQLLTKITGTASIKSNSTTSRIFTKDIKENFEKYFNVDANIWE